MRLYLSANTNKPDIIVDYIEVMLKSGERVSLNWDESDIARDETGFSARYKGVYFDEDYSNGRISELEDVEILEFGLYTDINGPTKFDVTEMKFEDNDISLDIEVSSIPKIYEADYINNFKGYYVSSCFDRGIVRTNENNEEEICNGYYCQVFSDEEYEDQLDDFCLAVGYEIKDLSEVSLYLGIQEYLSGWQYNKKATPSLEEKIVQAEQRVDHSVNKESVPEREI